MSEKNRRCFVISPIGEEGSLDRRHADMMLNNVIREALKEFDPPYEILRSDEMPDPGMITDVMIHEIMNAELVIADLTYLDPNVFYELGIRHAVSKPVIHVAQSGTKLPFDTITHRAVIQDITSWEGTQRARQQIRETVRAIEKPGYRVSNPITQANASFRMLQSADPTEQVVADHAIRIEQLEAHLHSARSAADATPAVNHLLRPGFGERLLNSLPSNATDADRMLLAGYVAGGGTFESGFGLQEANALLTKQGFKIGNPAEALKQNIIAKRVRRHLGGRYRISEIGIQHLLELAD